MLVWQKVRIIVLPLFGNCSLGLRYTRQGIRTLGPVQSQQSPRLAVRHFALDLTRRARLDVPLEVQLEAPLRLALLYARHVEYDDLVRLDQGPDVQDRDEDAGPAGEDDGHEIGGQGVELAQIAGLSSSVSGQLGWGLA